MSLSLSLALAIGAGVSAGVFGDPWLVGHAPWILALSGLATLTGFSRRRYRLAAIAGHSGLVALSMVIGVSAHERALHSPLRRLLEQRHGGFSIDDRLSAGSAGPVTIEGRLRGDATLTETGATLVVAVERIWIGVCPETTSGGVLLAVSGTLATGAIDEWRAGRVVRMPALLRRPARYLNRGVPDHERLLARRGVSLVGSVKSAALVEVVSRGRWFDEAAASARARVRAALARHIGARDPQSAAIGTAILIGDRAALDPDVEVRLQEAGTYHVIAISGGNIAIFTGLIVALLWRLGLRGAPASAVAIPMLFSYAVIAGSGSSVVRATLMATIYLSLRVIDQRTAPVHALALTVACVLLAAPLTITDVGFWFTVWATAAIIAASSTESLSASWARLAAAIVLASVAAEAVLMPIGALVFQRVTVAGPLLNVVAVPCMAVVQIAAMATVAADVAAISPVASIAGWVAHLGSRGLVESASFVDLAPWLTWRVVSPSLAIVVAYYVALVIHWKVSRTLLDTRTRKLLHGGSRVTAIALFVWIAFAPPTLARERGDGRLRLTMMDVGQGDSLLVQFPNGRRLMVDAGGVSVRGAFDIGERVLGPALRARGITHLDALAITHGDPDHIGGALSVLRAFVPIEVWEGVPVANQQSAAQLHESASAQRASWRTLQRGDRFEVGGVEIRVHHPPLPDWERQKVRNDDSLVFELRFGRVSLLLTGDIGRDVEQVLIPQLDLLPLVVLKSPHHGSGTSSSAGFLTAIKPHIVLISCGRANPYGHPVPYVLGRYHDVGAEIFRTDQEGQLDVMTDGDSITVETFTGRRLGLR